MFCRTRTEVDQLTETLNGRGYRAEALHGGMTQEGRDRVMGRLRNGTAELLVATDVAARGLDVDQLTHVINYDVPSAPDAYVHRIGRVGRAGREGVAITLAEPRELRLLGNIERVTGRPIAIEKVPSVADLRARQMEATAAVAARRWRPTTSTASTPCSTRCADGDDVRDDRPGRDQARARGPPSEVDEIEIPEFVPRDSDKDKGKRGDRPAPRQASGQPGGRYQGGAKTRLFIGLGKNDRIRPGDLVGAIANESDLTGRDIGPINITDKFSTVDVPADAADAVIAAIKQTTIRGKRPTIRRDRHQQR